MILWPRTRTHVALGLSAAVGMTLVLGALSATSARTVPSATAVTNIDGSVYVRRAGDGLDFIPARLGDILHVGDTVWAGAGTAEVTYFDGSSLQIGADTLLVIAPLNLGDSSDATVNGFDRAWYVVTRLVTVGSRYELRTPTSSATIRG